MKGDLFSLNLDETFLGKELQYELLNREEGAQINTIFHERFAVSHGTTKTVKMIHRLSNQFMIIFF